MKKWITTIIVVLVIAAGTLWVFKDNIFGSNNESGTAESLKGNPDTVIFPEGYTARKIAEKVSKKINYDADEIIARWSDKDFIKKLSNDFPDLIKYDQLVNKDISIPLEGYLFAAAYIIKKEEKPQDVAYKMVKRTNAELQRLKPLVSDTGKDFHFILTLASVIEKEASAENRKMISSIFWNRLKAKPQIPWGSDVTVNYGIAHKDKNLKPNSLSRQQYVNFQSPYNSYIHIYPVGPVCSPNIKSVEAALLPEHSDYLFFIGFTKDGQKVYKYAKTLAEHNKYIAEYSKYF